MSDIVCTMPQCQTSAGCRCSRTPYVSPFMPTVADEYFAKEIKTLNDEIERLRSELSTAYRRGREDMREEAAKVAEECAIMGNLNDVNACGEMLDAWDLGVEETQEQVAAAIRKMEA